MNYFIKIKAPTALPSPTKTDHVLQAAKLFITSTDNFIFLILFKTSLFKF